MVLIKLRIFNSIFNKLYDQCHIFIIIQCIKQRNIIAWVKEYAETGISPGGLSEPEIGWQMP